MVFSSKFFSSNIFSKFYSKYHWFLFLKVFISLGSEVTILNTLTTEGVEQLQDRGGLVFSFNGPSLRLCNVKVRPHYAAQQNATHCSFATCGKSCSAYAANVIAST